MSQTYNVYCDESCHLENDGKAVMVLGGVWCERDKVRDISRRLREIKARHGFARSFELKWTKVSPSKRAYYRDVVDFFFDNAELHFRGLIVPDKSKLDHVRHGQTHDEWYYKMYFTMLKAILSPLDRFKVFLDIKDTRGGLKLRKLGEVLRNSMYDFSAQIVEDIQQVRSHDVEILQVADLLIGALSYVNHGHTGSAAKAELVERIRARSGYKLTQSTLLRERKMNLFRWEPASEGV